MKSYLKLIFLIFILSFIIFINFSIPVSAMTFTPQIGIGEFKSGVPVTVEGNTIGKYILAIYNFAIGVIGIIAVIVMMIGGVIWITAAGSSERVGLAKEYIGASLLGLILLLSSYTILNTINPNLTRFNSIDPTKTAADTGQICCNTNTGPISPVQSPGPNNQQVLTCPGSALCAMGEKCLNSTALKAYQCTKEKLCCQYKYGAVDYYCNEIDSGSCPEKIMWGPYISKFEYTLQYSGLGQKCTVDPVLNLFTRCF